MTTIKKQYQEIHALMLELIADKPRVQLNSILPQLEALMQSKKAGSSNGTTFHKDEEGNVVAIYCYYHKCWELIADVEYGVKKNTATGLNTMCKEGVSAWSKQQRTYAKTKDELLMQVAAGEAIELRVELDKAEEARKAIVPHSKTTYATLEEALADI